MLWSGRCRFYLLALKFCFSRSLTAVNRKMQILFSSFFSRSFSAVVRKMQILSASFEVLLEQLLGGLCASLALFYLQ